MQSSRKFRKACALCHERKIRCDGATPSCQNCLQAHVSCRPHERRRRLTGGPSFRVNGESHLSQTTQRLAWLEQELHRVLGIDIRLFRTGAPLDCLSHNRCMTHAKEQASADITIIPQSRNLDHRPPVSSNEDRPQSYDEVDPDISLLVLNATGESRYLGASSGSFFAKYITNIAQSLNSKSTEEGFNIQTHQASSSSSSERVVSIFPYFNWRTTETFPFLLRCYLRWVHSIYPLFPTAFFKKLESISVSGNLPQENGDLTVIFYLVLSLGAIHSEQAHLLKEVQDDVAYQAYQEASKQGLSAEVLYRKAMAVFESEIQSMAPRISIVQILNLISIYASHRPSDNKQWHIGGMAMRLAIELGLHRQNDSWKFTTDEFELRRLVFWNTYAIEITLSFNLGRPASISFEDADTPFPQATTDMIMPIHHIRHRQIQEKMLSQVYRGRKKTNLATSEAIESTLTGLQEELDKWHQDLHELYPQSTSPYPIEYWDRLYYASSAALSRPTPLVPWPEAQSHERCFLSSGRVIEIYDKLIRHFRLPNSWMLLQGLALAAVSMIVTARNNALDLSQRIGFETLLDNLTTSIRKIHVVTAVMTERGAASIANSLENLLDKLFRDTVENVIRMMVNERSLRVSSQDRPGDDTNLSGVPSLLNQRFSERESSAPPAGPFDHMHDEVPNSPGNLRNISPRREPINASNSMVDPGLWGLDPDANGSLFNNLFDSNELQIFFDLFPGESYVT